MSFVLTISAIDDIWNAHFERDLRENAIPIARLTTVRQECISHELPHKSFSFRTKYEEKEGLDLIAHVRRKLLPPGQRRESRSWRIKNLNNKKVGFLKHFYICGFWLATIQKAEANTSSSSTKRLHFYKLDLVCHLGTWLEKTWSGDKTEKATKIFSLVESWNSGKKLFFSSFKSF